ncbi:MAG: hypothetical protein H0V73_10295 [Chloroflexi bacterium]|nr:hypothetical protein [Chloroflexota bacterium]
MTHAAVDAASGARRIPDALKGVLPDLPKSDPRFVATIHLVTIASFGQQLDVLFEPGEVPDARLLATVEIGLQHVAAEQQGLNDALAAAHIGPC